MSQRKLAILALLTTSVIWGVSIPLMKSILEVVPPLTIAFIRFASASFLVFGFSELKGLSVKDFFQIGIFALFGISLHVGLLILGLSDTSAIDATLILAFGPIIASLLATVFLNEKINFIHSLGIFLALAGGIIYFVWPSLLSGELKINLFGDLLVLISTLSLAVYTVGSKELFTLYSPKKVTAVSFLIGMFTFFPGTILEIFTHPNWVANVDLQTITSLLFLGVFSVYIAYHTLEWGLSKVPVYVNTTISYLSPLISVLVAVLFLGEKLTLLFVISAIFVTLGIYFSVKTKPHHHFRTHRV